MRKSRLFNPPVLYALALVFLPLSANSQDNPSLMVLGSAHFGNPGRDTNNIVVEDVLTDRRQQEIEALVQQLAEFRPTHIAVEISSSNQAALDKRYQDYRNGQYELTRNEADQLGLRLAAKLGHDHIYAVDWNGNPPGDYETNYDWFSYGQSHGHEVEIAAITDPKNAQILMPNLREDQTIGQWLRQLNTPAALQASHKAYFDIARIGDGEELIGANWVGTWYARNLKIYSRLLNLATKPDDRVLIIYGQGHAYLLQQFAREHGKFELTSVEDVLKE
jgi:hypothetical protein